MVLAVLAGCHRSLDYAYLTSHPSALQSAFKQCEETEFAEPDCLVVRQAMIDFVNLVNENQKNQEAFGKKILEAEYEMVNAKIELHRLKGMGSQFAEAKKVYQAKREKVNMLLAVVAASGSE